MKKFLLVAGIIGVCMAGQAAEFTKNVVSRIEGNYHWGYSLDYESYKYHMIYVTTENSVNFKIYNDNGQIEKEFTISNLTPNPESAYTKNIIVQEIAIQDCVSAEDFYIYASQKIFNNDDKYEVVIRQYTGTGHDDYETRVYSETGEMLGIISKDALDVFGELPDMIDFGDAKYFRLSDQSSCELFTLTFDGSGVEKVEAPKSVTRAYPNPLPSGRSFTIELDAPAAEGTTVSVVDMSGKTVYKGAVPAGSDKAFVPSTRKLHGSHIFVVECNGSIIERGKLVAQ